MVWRRSAFSPEAKEPLDRLGWFTELEGDNITFACFGDEIRQSTCMNCYIGRAKEAFMICSRLRCVLIAKTDFTKFASALDLGLSSGTPYRRRRFTVSTPKLAGDLLASGLDGSASVNGAVACGLELLVNQDHPMRLHPDDDSDLRKDTNGRLKGSAIKASHLLICS